jgi:hypothetical protein
MNKVTEEAVSRDGDPLEHDPKTEDGGEKADAAAAKP